jgi:Family of unknown function (DUF6152)
LKQETSIRGKAISKFSTQEEHQGAIAMRSYLLGATMSIASLLAPQSTLYAHHSIAGQFDTTQTLHLTGVVSRGDWVNPHSYIYIDVTDAAGAVTTWKLESLPVAMLRKAGITKAALMDTSTKVKADVHPSRDGSAHWGFLIRLTYPDGRYYQFSRDPNDKNGPTVGGAAK